MQQVICEVIAKDGPSMLDFSDDVHNMQRRIAFVATRHPELSLPSVDVETICKSAVEWGPLFICNATTTNEQKKIDICEVIWSRLSYEQQKMVEQLAPTHIVVPTLSQLQKQSQPSQGVSSQTQLSPEYEGFVALSGITKPEKPTKWKDMIVCWLCFLPWHHVRAFFASRYVKWWFHTILFCVWLTSVFLTCIIATDNAKMHKVQEKYVLLREFARPNNDWADKADYIEYLYSDEDGHRTEIEDLWEHRRKRLCK